MRVVFMGTPDFAVPSLLALHESHEVVAVYTRPDSVSRRGKLAVPSPVKAAAVGLGIPVTEARSLRDGESVEALRALAPDISVVAAYGVILPQEVLEVPRFGSVNVHASLLPRWRGAAPIQRAILADDYQTGVSIMRMEEGLDTGPYCTQVRTAVDGKSAPELTVELARLGAQALLDALPRIENGTCEWCDQDEALVTYAQKINKSDVALSPSLAAGDIMLRVRASSDAAPARAAIADKGVTVLEVRVSDAQVTEGSVRCDHGDVILGARGGAVSVVRLRPDGKNEMDAASWVRGMRLGDDASWSAS